MKKIVSIVLCIAIVAAFAVSLVGCGTPRDEILKLYMPGEYIDEELFQEFEAWYLEETGKKVTVQLKTFSAVENIQLALEGSRADYDLICPSDYMVEYLLSKNLLQKVDKNILDVTEAGLFKSQYLDTTREFDPTLEYAVPYMYGTLGLVYDRSKTGREITSWEALFGSEFAGRRSIKKSVRDAYAAACIYNARADLDGLEGAAQKAAVQAVFEDTSDATIAAAKNILRSTINGGAVWDVDNVKFNMAAGRGNVAVALMWSCDAGYVMNDYEDADGNEQVGNRNLWYVVPEEGGNVYIDCFCISKYAKNVQAANYFLKFLCEKDTAVQNSEYAGCISPVAAAYDELLLSYTEDEDGMFDGTAEGWKEMFLETMFPSAATLNRCGVMKDFGSGKTAVNRMWADLQ
ncbi:MAG: extracellular solute-binding protein [Clostridia bacterium]|nr:extracellular solute-binding protein [Clostridia bacterium]